MLPLIFIPLMFPFPFPLKNGYLSVPLSANSFTEEQFLSIIQYSLIFLSFPLKCLCYFFLISILNCTELWPNPRGNSLETLLSLFLYNFQNYERTNILSHLIMWTWVWFLSCFLCDSVLNILKKFRIFFSGGGFIKKTSNFLKLSIMFAAICFP